MNLQSLYRIERDNIIPVEKDEYYFAYKIINDEFHVLEIYIKEEFRGDSKKYYQKIVEFIETFSDVKYIVGFIIPKTIGAERSLKSLLNFGFKLLNCDTEKITLYREI